MSKGKILNRSVVIKAKLPDSAYYKRNAKYIEVKPRPLGSNITVVNKIKANPTLIGKVLPFIIGVQPNDSLWGKHVSAYLDGYNTRITEIGKKLDIGLGFLSTSDREEFETKLSNITKAYTKGVEANPNSEKEFYRTREEDELSLEDDYLETATPTNHIDYLLWRIARIHKNVANREVDKRLTHITFYLENEIELKRVADERFKLVKSANEKYFDIVRDASKVNNILRVIVKAHETVNLDTLDELGKQKLLMTRISVNPSEFLNVLKDANLDIKATIEEYISIGILRRLPDSSVIVENGTNDIIGNTLNDTISFFKDETNHKLKLAQFKEKYKARPNK